MAREDGSALALTINPHQVSQPLMDALETDKGQALRRMQQLATGICDLGTEMKRHGLSAEIDAIRGDVRRLAQASAELAGVFEAVESATAAYQPSSHRATDFADKLQRFREGLQQQRRETQQPGESAIFQDFLRPAPLTAERNGNNLWLEGEAAVLGPPQASVGEQGEQGGEGAEAGGEDGDDDVQIDRAQGVVFKNLTCPLTGVGIYDLREPCEDSEGIVYERQSIEAYLRERRGTAMCPQAGTQHQVSLLRLQPASRVLREKRRQQVLSESAVVGHSSTPRDTLLR